MSVKESTITKDQFRGDILQRDYSAKYNPDTKTYEFDYVEVTPELEEALKKITYSRIVSSNIADIENAIANHIKKLGASGDTTDADSTTGTVNSTETASTTGTMNNTETASTTGTESTLVFGENNENTESVKSTKSRSEGDFEPNEKQEEEEEVDEEVDGEVDEEVNEEVDQEVDKEDERKYKEKYNEAVATIRNLQRKEKTTPLTATNTKELQNAADIELAYNTYRTGTNNEKKRAKVTLDTAIMPVTAGLYGNLNEGLQGGKRKKTKTRKLKHKKT